MNRFISPRRRRSWRALSPFAAAPFAAAMVAVAALVALAGACAGFERGGGGDDPDVPSVISHSARVDADNGQIVFVSVVLSEPERAAVEYENEFAGKFRTALSETAVEHVIPVVRLRADTAYQYAVGVEKAGGGLARQARGSSLRGRSPAYSPRC